MMASADRIAHKLRRLHDKIFLRHKRRKIRRFADPRLGRLGLFEQLHQRQVRYAVLRWFDKLPDWPAGEDVDLLVDINDLDRIDDLFVRDDRSIPCDVYATAAAKGADMKGLAYYPTNLADQILSSRVMFKDHCFVPNAEHYFLSLAFHAVYHKAESSGLPWDSSVPCSAPPVDQDHHYATVLSRARPDHFRDVPMTITDLHGLMSEHGWAPAIDTLRKYAIFRPELLKLAPPPVANGDGEMLLFVFRQAAVDHGMVNEAIELLQSKERLEVIARKSLTPAESALAAASIRGGNWGKGPYPSSGGSPAEFVAFFDYHPKPLSRLDRKRYPHVQNRRVLLKSKIRDQLNARLPHQQQCNCVHTADDQVEAEEYLMALGGDFHQQVIGKANRIRNAYRTNEPVIRTLRKPAHRSKTMLIQWHGGQAVKKTFRLSAKRFLEREIFAFEHLSKVCDTVPELLDHDETSLVMPYFTNVMEGMSLKRRRRLLRPYAKEVLEVMKAMFDLGRFAIDFHPGNLILTPERKLYFVDFEFLQEYDRRPERFEESADLTGLPPGFDGDRPCNLPPQGYTYDDFWKPIFRRPLEDLLQDFGLASGPPAGSQRPGDRSTAASRAAA